ncbi:MAG: flagellar hook protein FlgE [Nitrospirae bacterium]|nr:flagellar hook protein FlgE [Nitrospirota bacterium]MBI3352052.1 flagellar hook protein FlgE [Nitrospirota bacterium]
MSILTSLFSGISGLNAYGTGLSVVGNNIANLNTVGFKDGEASFADIVSQSLSGASGTSQVGRGVYVDGVMTQFTQGSFETTSNGLDLGIEGDGFFNLRDPNGVINYSRNGTFNIDKNGFVANPEGLLLRGFQADQAGNLTGQIGDINLGSTTFPPLATANATVVANLDSRSAVIPGGFVLGNPSQTSNFSDSITAYDSLGNSHLVTLYFTETATAAAGNTWAWNAVVNAKDSSTGSPAVGASGVMTFNTNGALTSMNTISNAFNFSSGATQGQVIAFNLGTPLPGGTGLNGITQYGSTSAVLNQTQDGYASGTLQSESVSKAGIITGLFTNGKNRTLAQVVLARFNNPQGLTHLGNNLFGVTADSGQPIVGTPNASGIGGILSNSLELSNVDLAQQFVKMIEYQRGFQANGKVITTTDEMLQELVNLKR